MIWLLPWEDDNEVRHTHWALYVLLAINVAVFIAMWAAPPAELAEWYRDYGLVAGDPRWYQWVTSMFVHAGLWHLVGNMLFLWVLGDNVEDVLGPLGFLTVYFVGGIAGDVLFSSANPGNMTPNVGASGGVAAIAGAYAVMFASRPVTVRVMLIVFPIAKVSLHAFWVLLFWFAADLAQTLLTRGVMEAPGINYVAHAGGFAVGFLVGIAARAHGVMVRYETVPSGAAWFGYWPERLAHEHRRERARAVKRERLLHEARARRSEGDGKWR